jgi:branched-chain amino acid transport system substrate-binding protein
LASRLPFARLASAADAIKVGAGMSLTGALAAGGRAALTTMRMWVADVNRRGGLLGRQVELVHYDDQGNPANVPAIYGKLLDVDKADLVVSGYGTNLQVPAMPMMMERKLLFMGSMGTGSNDKFKYDRFFQAFPAGPNARLALSEGYFEAAASMNPRPNTVALIGADAEFSQTALSGARENAQKYGLKVVFDSNYPLNTVEFGPLLRGVAASKPDVIYVASYPPDTVAIIRAAGEMGLKAAMFGGGMVGTQYAPLKTHLGPQLNGIVSFELYVPEPTMKRRSRQSSMRSGTTSRPTFTRKCRCWNRQSARWAASTTEGWPTTSARPHSAPSWARSSSVRWASGRNPAFFSCSSEISRATGWSSSSSRAGT